MEVTVCTIIRNAHRDWSMIILLQSLHTYQFTGKHINLFNNLIILLITLLI